MDIEKLNEILRKIALGPQVNELDLLKEAHQKLYDYASQVDEETSKVLISLLKEMERIWAKVENIQLIPGPQGEPGKDGSNYVLTQEDRKIIAKLIEVPIVEKVIERTEVIKEIPIVTENIVEKAIPETPEEIRDKLETLKGDERLDKSAIKDLEEALDRLEEKINTSNKTILGYGGMPAKVEYEINLGNLGSAVTIDWSKSTRYRGTLTANCTFTFIPPKGAATLRLQLTQDSTGGRTTTWPSAVKPQRGVNPFQGAQVANEVDRVYFEWNQTTYDMYASFDHK